MSKEEASGEKEGKLEACIKDLEEKHKKQERELQKIEETIKKIDESTVFKM